MIPQFDNIDKFKFYDLNAYGWDFSNSYDSIENNNPIIETLSADFSEISGIALEQVLKAFDISHINTRTEEEILLIYSNQASDTVYYYFTNMNTSTYRTLTRS